MTAANSMFFVVNGTALPARIYDSELPNNIAKKAPTRIDYGN